MATLRAILNSKPFLWALLALPALAIAYTYVTLNPWPDEMLHPTGEWSARLMIVALMMTPLSQLFRGRRWIQWLIRRRRAFGALQRAGFAFADRRLESALESVVAG